MEKKRIYALDLLRSVAIIFVIILHSVTLSGVLSREILSPFWTLSLYARHLAFSCVPLFIMLTGYLQRKKTLSPAFYKGIIPVGVSYIIISVLSLIAKSYADSTIVLTPSLIITKILDFSANDYAWYFEMYIGLFLLIPFLNILYNNIGTKGTKLIFIITLAFLTLAPETLKSFSPSYTGGLLSLNFIPDFFADMYPLTYYFIGAYFNEYKPFGKFCGAKRLVRLLMALSAPLVPATLCYFYTKANGAYAWYMMNGMNTLTIMFTAISVFALLYDLEPRLGALKFIVKTVSESTFEIYLLSFIFDSFYYRTFSFATPVMVLLVFVSSLMSAVILRLVILKPLSALLVRLYVKCTDKARV